MSRLLIDEQPLQVLPNLAKAIGLNEGIVLQQLHYWLHTSKHSKDGRKWVYNTYEDWQEQFPFWSKSTIRRTINSLEKQGLIETKNYNKIKSDRTKWYSINYQSATLYQLMNSPCVQNEQSKCSDWTLPTAQNEHMVNQRLPEITTENVVVNKRNAFTVFEQSGFGMLSGTIIDNINHWIDDFKDKGSTDQEADELVSLAIKKADENGVRKWNYANKILLNWLNKGFTKPSDVEAHEKQREQSKEKKTEEGKPDLSWEEELDNL
jgi:DnaD/phage-associated family protein